MDGIPREIHNPQSGEHITVLKRGSETDGQLFKARITLPPTGEGPPGHRHKSVTETFTVESGTLTIMCGSKKNTRPYGQGESVRVEPLVAHRFRNYGPEITEFDLEVVPARNFETHLHVVFGLARDGRTTKDGMPKSLFDMALLFELADTYLLGMPMWFQTGVFSPVAALARWLGKPPDFPEFWNPNHGRHHDHDHAGARDLPGHDHMGPRSDETGQPGDEPA